jgi:hypothetical protein
LGAVRVPKKQKSTENSRADPHGHPRKARISGRDDNVKIKATAGCRAKSPALGKAGGNALNEKETIEKSYQTKNFSLDLFL